MYGILKSLGINFMPHEYVHIIRECFNTQHNLHSDNENSNNEETETDNNNYSESVVEELLLLHQKRLVTRQNLPDEYDFNNSSIEEHYSNEILYNYNGRQYSFFELINHWIYLRSLNPIEVMKEMANHRSKYILERCDYINLMNFLINLVLFILN